MNRLAVYSYLTRNHYEHSGSDRLFAAPLPHSNNVRQSYKIAMHTMTDRQYESFSLTDSQNLCQTIVERRHRPIPVTSDPGILRTLSD